MQNSRYYLPWVLGRGVRLACVREHAQNPHPLARGGNAHTDRTLHEDGKAHTLQGQRRPQSHELDSYHHSGEPPHTRQRRWRSHGHGNSTTTTTTRHTRSKRRCQTRPRQHGHYDGEPAHTRLRRQRRTRPHQQSLGDGAATHGLTRAIETAP
jgi:hypothetical protein